MNAMKFAIPLFVALAYGPAQGLAAVPLIGSDLASFAVLGGSGVTNVPTSTVFGNVGTWESGGANAITGFNSSPGVAVSDPQVTGGQVHAGTTTGTPNAMTAQGQLTFAWTSLFNLASTPINITGVLDGLSITPGVYDVSAAPGNGGFNLSVGATLLLDANGQTNPLWVFQMPSTFKMDTGSTVAFTDAPSTGFNPGVFWEVGSSATLNAGTTLQGNIVALTSIEMLSTAKIECGSAWADNGAVTMIMNSIRTGCNGNFQVTTTPGGGTVVTPIPEPEIYAMMAVGLGLLGWVGRRKKLKEAAAA